MKKESQEPNQPLANHNEIALVIDKATGLPLCVLLQAIYNPVTYSMPHFIPSSCWQLHPPKQPMLVRGSVEQWKSIVPRMIQLATRGGTGDVSSRAERVTQEEQNEGGIKR